MPRKTKEQNDKSLLKNEEINEIKKQSSGVKSKKDADLKSTKKTSSTKDSVVEANSGKILNPIEKIKKSVERNITSKATTSRKSTSKDEDVLVSEELKTSKKSSTTGKSTTTRKSTAKKSTSKSTAKKSSTKSDSTTKKSSTSKSSSAEKKTSSKVKNTSTSRRKATKAIEESDDILLKPTGINPPEYYDLPYRYNQTVVKVLAQTPNNLFIYWDISDEDRENFKKQYGENFFEITRPVLIVHNDTLNYTFEVSINDFANSWYLHVNDSKSDYRIELGRRPIDYYQFKETVKNYQEDNNIEPSPYISDYIYISTSNEMESPNDRILLKNYVDNKVTFRNVRTNEIKEKPISAFPITKRIFAEHGIFDIAKLYEFLYKEENINDVYNFSNPSSGNPSSGSLSSRFQ